MSESNHTATPSPEQPVNLSQLADRLEFIKRQIAAVCEEFDDCGTELQLLCFSIRDDASLAAIYDTLYGFYLQFNVPENLDAGLDNLIAKVRAAEQARP